MHCYGCGYNGKPGPRHDRVHWTCQLARVAAFKQAHGTEQTWRMNGRGERVACSWSVLCQEAEAVLRTLLEAVA